MYKLRCLNPFVQIKLSRWVMSSMLLTQTDALNARHFDEPQCQLLCPVECIDVDEVESPEQLLSKLHRLQD